MKIDTTTILIAGAAAVGIYLLTRPATTPTYPLGYNPYAATPLGAYPAYQQPNSTASIISAGAPVINNLLDNIFG